MFKVLATCQKKRKYESSFREFVGIRAKCSISSVCYPGAAKKVPSLLFLVLKDEHVVGACLVFSLWRRRDGYCSMKLEGTHCEIVKSRHSNGGWALAEPSSGARAVEVVVYV